MKIINLIFLINLFLNLVFGNELKNSGAMFNNPKDYYVPENLNYFSGGYSEAKCQNSKWITIPLGTTGGLDEGNLSSFLLTKKGSSLFIALDAGTVWQGLRRLTTLQDFNTIFNISYPDWANLPEQRATWFLKNHVIGYFIGHSHLDHVGGLIVESAEDQYSWTKTLTESRKPEIYKGTIGLYHDLGLINSSMPVITVKDPKKPIIGLSSTLNSISDDLFNGKVWPNLPSFGRYFYYHVSNGLEYTFDNFMTGDNMLPKQKMHLVANQFPFDQKIKMFELCHDNLMSSAFLFTDNESGEQIAFFSDTGISTGTECDWEGKILQVWRNIKLDKLKAIYIESSFTNEVAEASLFGHLRPKDIMKLLDLLMVNSIQSSPPTRNLKHVKLIVEHIKPQIVQSQFQMTSQRLVYQQLQEINTHNIKVVIPNQGMPICF